MAINPNQDDHDDHDSGTNQTTLTHGCASRNGASGVQSQSGWQSPSGERDRAAGRVDAGQARDGLDVAVLSLRRVRLVPWIGGLVQAEDVLIDCLGARRHDVVFRHERLANSTISMSTPRRLLSLTTATHPFAIRPASECPADLLVIIANDLHDLALAIGAKGWNNLGDRVLVYLAEVAHRHLHIYHNVIRKLTQRADFVFLGTDIVPPERFLRDRVKVVGSTLPLLDVSRFPSRPHAERPIDVLNFGRRSAPQHQALRTWASANNGFYLHDTGPRLAVWDIEDHRRCFTDTASRSRLIVTNYARFDEHHNTGGVRVMGTRFLEAAAAGAVLCGDRPTRDPLSHDGLIDALESVAFALDDCRLPREIERLLNDVEASDERARRVRSVALEHFDVAHQWTTMASMAGLPIDTRIIDRIDDLTIESKQLRG